METEILNKILVQVEKIGTDLTEFKQEVRERFDKNEKELKEFKEEMLEFKEEMYEFKDEMYEFKGEVYELFDKNTQEIADEIHEVGRMMSRKTKQAVKEVKQEIRQEIKAIVDMNEKEHNVFRAQIEKLQYIEKYVPEPFSSMEEEEIEENDEITEIIV